MFIVYILKNTRTNRHYIGSTNNFNRRLSEHNRGQTRSTKSKGTWLVVYKEEYLTHLAAHRREKQIKRYKGGAAFKKLIGEW